MLYPKVTLNTLLVRVVQGRVTTLYVAYPSQVRVCADDPSVWSAVVFEESGDRQVLDQSSKLVHGAWLPLDSLGDVYGEKRGGEMRKLAVEFAGAEEFDLDALLVPEATPAEATPAEAPAEAPKAEAVPTEAPKAPKADKKPPPGKKNS